ncbi:MAG: hypothetical protein H7Y36_04235 [Armatimonadetes bacterium]|nr:hypothetical protein [Akkermansiaceae bacterium]
MKTNTHLSPGLFGITVTALTVLSASAAINAVYLPHGPANPSNAAWNPTPGTARDSYRDIPWWFEDNNPASASNGIPGAADAYDISVVYAARLNKINASGYEAAIIDTPAPIGSHYGTPGGTYGTAANSVTWGNNTIWNFTLVYDWNNGSPTASSRYQSGATVHLASATLGNRVTDFVNGTGPYKEQHVLSDVLMRFATIGAYGASPQVTRSSLTVGNLSASVGSGPTQPINFEKDNQTVNSLTTTWQHVPGGTDITNPRQVEFLVIDNLIPNHQTRLEVTGTLAFSWDGSASAIAGSGLIYELKLGDLDYFPGAVAFVPVPEPKTALLGAFGLLALLRRRNSR